MGFVLRIVQRTVHRLLLAGLYLLLAAFCSLHTACRSLLDPSAYYFFLNFPDRHAWMNCAQAMGLSRPVEGAMP